MGAVDPKDMTASELLRWATNGEPYYGVDGNSWTYSTGKIRALVEDVTGEFPSDHEAFSIIADKIDAELSQARELSLLHGAELWAKANGWPDFREGEDFGAWLERCALPRPRFEDGEVVGVREYEDIQGYCVYDDGEFFVTTPNRSIDYAAGERVERPAPEALGADGKPIKDGETVWLDEAHSRCAGSCGFEDGNGYSLYGIERQEMLTVEDAHIEVDGREYVRVCTCGAWCHASWLTHTPPETQARIDEDASLPPREYYARHIGHDVGLKGAVEVHSAVTAHLLKRQRELDAKGAI